MKKFKDNRGSALLEALCAFFIISMLIVQIMPFAVDFSVRKKEKAAEIEQWRFAQDAALQSLHKEGNKETSSISDANKMEAKWRNNGFSLFVSSGSKEVISVEYRGAE